MTDDRDALYPEQRGPAVLGIIQELERVLDVRVAQQLRIDAAWVDGQLRGMTAAGLVVVTDAPGGSGSGAAQSSGSKPTT